MPLGTVSAAGRIFFGSTLLQPARSVCVSERFFDYAPLYKFTRLTCTDIDNRIMVVQCNSSVDPSRTLGSESDEYPGPDCVLIDSIQASDLGENGK